MDDQETENQETDGEAEPAKQAEPDPRETAWAAEREALRAERDQYKTIATIAAQRQQPQQAPQLRNVEPDYDEAASRVGMSGDQFRALTAVAEAKVAHELAELRNAVQALTPKLEDKLGDLAEEFGLGKWDAIKYFGEAKDALGEQATNDAVLRKARSVLKAANQSAEPHATAVTRGGSMPPGRQPKPAEQKYETLVQIIKKDQRKRGLYAY